MVFRKLFKAFKGTDPGQLVVRGVITETGKHQPRTHLGPTQAAEEAWFAIDIEDARTTSGQSLSAAAIVPAEFSGEVGLLETFGASDRVEITATTATGRQIQSITKLA